jgi:hypothetical protein
LNIDAGHHFTKRSVDRVELVAGVGIVGDAHAGPLVQHRSRVRANPDQPNLRQVHLIDAELFAVLAAAGHHVDLWPGSVVGTDDPAVMRAKLGYTAFQAHLGEIVLHLTSAGSPGSVDSPGAAGSLDERAAWRIVRDVVDEAYSTLDSPAARADHAAFTAPTVPHKALVRMRLADNGDIYLPVENPLHG